MASQTQPGRSPRSCLTQALLCLPPYRHLMRWRAAQLRFPSLSSAPTRPSAPEPIVWLGNPSLQQLSSSGRRLAGARSLWENKSTVIYPSWQLQGPQQPAERPSTYRLNRLITPLSATAPSAPDKLDSFDPKPPPAKLGRALELPAGAVNLPRRPASNLFPSLHRLSVLPPQAPAGCRHPFGRPAPVCTLHSSLRLASSHSSNSAAGACVVLFSRHVLIPIFCTSLRSTHFLDTGSPAECSHLGRTTLHPLLRPPCYAAVTAR